MPPSLRGDDTAPTSGQAARGRQWHTSRRRPGGCARRVWIHWRGGRAPAVPAPHLYHHRTHGREPGWQGTCAECCRGGLQHPDRRFPTSTPTSDAPPTSPAWSRLQTWTLMPWTPSFAACHTARRRPRWRPCHPTSKLSTCRPTSASKTSRCMANGALA